MRLCNLLTKFAKYSHNLLMKFSVCFLVCLSKFMFFLLLFLEICDAFQQEISKIHNIFWQNLLCFCNLMTFEIFFHNHLSKLITLFHIVCRILVSPLINWWNLNYFTATVYRSLKIFQQQIGKIHNIYLWWAIQFIENCA